MSERGSFVFALWGLALFSVAAALGCAASPAPSPAQGRASAEAPAATAASASTPVATASAPRRQAPSACAPLACELFDSPVQAFQRVLAENPAVLAVGEAHAPADISVESATSRFGRELLPLLQGRATHLIVEVPIPDPRCFESAKDVKERQQAVTEKQATTNQNEFVALGQRARQLGILPLPLRPSCEDLSRVLGAGEDGIAEMLATIARLTADKAKEAVTRNKEKQPSGIVLAYGGALHNDAAPRADHPEWQFGPELSSFTGGRYVELDLIVPEFIKDTDAWRAQPWYSSFDPKANPDRVTLIRTGRASFALVFARSAPRP